MNNEKIERELFKIALFEVIDQLIDEYMDKDEPKEETLPVAPLYGPSSWL